MAGLWWDIASGCVPGKFEAKLVNRNYETLIAVKNDLDDFKGDGHEAVVYEDVWTELVPRMLPKRQATTQTVSEGEDRSGLRDKALQFWSTAMANLGGMATVEEFFKSLGTWAEGGMTFPASNRAVHDHEGDWNFKLMKFAQKSKTDETCFLVAARLPPYESEVVSLLLKHANDPFGNDVKRVERRMIFLENNVMQSYLYDVDLRAIQDHVEDYMKRKIMPPNKPREKKIEEMLRVDVKFYISSTSELNDEQKLRYIRGDHLNLRDLAIKKLTKVEGMSEGEAEARAVICDAEKKRKEEIKTQWDDAMTIFGKKEKMNFSDVAVKVPNRLVREAVLFVLWADKQRGGDTKIKYRTAYREAVLELPSNGVPRLRDNSQNPEDFEATFVEALQTCRRKFEMSQTYFQHVLKVTQDNENSSNVGLDTGSRSSKLVQGGSVASRPPPKKGSAAAQFPAPPTQEQSANRNPSVTQRSNTRSIADKRSQSESHGSRSSKLVQGDSMASRPPPMEGSAAAQFPSPTQGQSANRNPSVTQRSKKNRKIKRNKTKKQHKWRESKKSNRKP